MMIIKEMMMMIKIVIMAEMMITIMMTEMMLITIVMIKMMIIVMIICDNYSADSRNLTLFQQYCN